MKWLPTGGSEARPRAGCASSTQGRGSAPWPGALLFASGTLQSCLGRSSLPALVWVGKCLMSQGSCTVSPLDSNPWSEFPAGLRAALCSWGDVYWTPKAGTLGSGVWGATRGMDCSDPNPSSGSTGALGSPSLPWGHRRGTIWQEPQPVLTSMDLQYWESFWGEKQGQIKL